jgi:hypothetical protein
MDTHDDPSRTLRFALRANAAFSIISGLVLALGATALSPLMGIEPPAVLRVVGIGLLPFAAWLLYGAAREELSLADARVAVAADVLWVVGSAALIAFDPIGLSPAGRIAVGAVALCVADFAIWQSVGIGRLGRRAAVA